MFISVSLISNAFKTKQNVNDALEYIFEEINRDSYDVFKIKMNTNEANTNISFMDVNLVPPIPEKMLMFDITSNKSIVNTFDYNFAMPKGGLSAMIAIGENVDNKYFNDATKDYLNFIRILDTGRFGDDADFLSLPLRPTNSPVVTSEKAITERNLTAIQVQPIKNRMSINFEKTGASFAEAVRNIRLKKNLPGIQGAQGALYEEGKGPFDLRLEIVDPYLNIIKK